MAATREEVHELVDQAPAETLERVERLLRESTAASTGRRQALKRRLAEAGVLAVTTPLDRKHQDPAAVAAARARAGHGIPLSHYVSDERR